MDKHMVGAQCFINTIFSSIYVWKDRSVTYTVSPNMALRQSKKEDKDQESMQ